MVDVVDEPEHIRPSGVFGRLGETLGIDGPSDHRREVACVVHVQLQYGIGHSGSPSSLARDVPRFHHAERRFDVSHEDPVGVHAEPAPLHRVDPAGHQVVYQFQQPVGILAGYGFPVSVVPEAVVQEPVEEHPEVLLVQRLVAGDGRSAGEPLIYPEHPPGILGGIHDDGKAERVERLRLDHPGFGFELRMQRQLPLDALLHLVGGVVGEGQEQDLPRVDVGSGYQVHVSAHDRMGLPRPRAGVDEDHPVQGLGDHPLAVVQAVTHRPHPLRLR